MLEEGFALSGAEREDGTIEGGAGRKRRRTSARWISGMLSSSSSSLPTTCGELSFRRTFLAGGGPSGELGADASSTLLAADAVSDAVSSATTSSSAPRPVPSPSPSPCTSNLSCPSTSTSDSPGCACAPARSSPSAAWTCSSSLTAVSASPGRVDAGVLSGVRVPSASLTGVAGATERPGVLPLREADVVGSRVVRYDPDDSVPDDSPSESDEPYMSSWASAVRAPAVEPTEGAVEGECEEGGGEGRVGSARDGVEVSAGAVEGEEASEVVETVGGRERGSPIGEAVAEAVGARAAWVAAPSGPAGGAESGFGSTTATSGDGERSAAATRPDGCGAGDALSAAPDGASLAGGFLISTARLTRRWVPVTLLMRVFSSWLRRCRPGASSGALAALEPSHGMTTSCWRPDGGAKKLGPGGAAGVGVCDWVP